MPDPGITIIIDGDAAGLADELKAIQKNLGNFGGNAEQAADKGRAAFGGLQSKLGGVIATVLSLTAAFQTLRGALTAAANAEVLTSQFEQILGSVGAAQERMEELTVFAAKTPFEIPDIAKASKILETLTGGALATGEGLRMVGDVAAFTGENISGLSVWIGRLHDGLTNGRPVGEAMMRLQELGIISAATRAEIEDMQASGADGEQVWAVATEAMSKFDGAMERLSATMIGLISNLKDAWETMMRSFGSPVIEALKPAVEDLIELFTQWTPKVIQAGQGLGEFLTDVVAAMPEIIALAGSFLKLAVAIKAVSFIRVIAEAKEWQKAVADAFTKAVTVTKGAGPAIVAAIAGWEIGKAIERQFDISGHVTRALFGGADAANSRDNERLSAAYRDQLHALTQRNQLEQDTTAEIRKQNTLADIANSKRELENKLRREAVQANLKARPALEKALEVGRANARGLLSGGELISAIEKELKMQLGRGAQMFNMRMAGAGRSEDQVNASDITTGEDILALVNEQIKAKNLPAAVSLAEQMNKVLRLEKQLQSVKQSVANKEKQEAERAARKSKKERAPELLGFLGLGDSLTSIGGGGNFTLGGAVTIDQQQLDETKNQTKVLERIETAVTNGGLEVTTK